MHLLPFYSIARHMRLKSTFCKVLEDGVVGADQFLVCSNNEWALVYWQERKRFARSSAAHCTL